MDTAAHAPDLDEVLEIAVQLPTFLPAADATFPAADHPTTAPDGPPAPL
ncbi:hypothetical protein GCM10010123_37660 [Pilimelia anulata]|uniref:Uncharacterized protein n=1 Tax=Pilimelia anulata TaxID=53371 RepID=A0A8J3B908_9ACTN|nr:hypothetical protein [Pilimelia anulata]GGK04177.1 hypothetical protein GCM10010123_37660 [Pilimelia anulata]